MRWLRYVPIVFGLPLLALAPVAAWGAYSVGGWGAASAAALALGIVAIAFQGPTFEGLGHGGRSASRACATMCASHERQPRAPTANAPRGSRPRCASC